MEVFIEDLEVLIFNAADFFCVCINDVEQRLNKNELWDLIHLEKILAAEILSMNEEDVYYISTDTRDIVIIV